ncbi:hypothetical protein Tco_0583309, partial [Tanacetum coccineum]
SHIVDLDLSKLSIVLQRLVRSYTKDQQGPRDSSLKSITGCDKESDNSKENTDDSLEQHQITNTETSSFETPLKVDKDWKEKFFYPANHYWVSDDEDEDESPVLVKKKTVIPTAAKIQKPVRKPMRYAEMYSSHNQQRKRIVSGNNYNKKDNDCYSKPSHPSTHKHMAPRAVLMKTGLKSFNTERPVNTVRSINTGSVLTYKNDHLNHVFMTRTLKQFDVE